MKKLVLFLLLFILIFSTVSFAALPQTHGELLQEMGIISGTGQGLAEDKTLTRAELVSILVKLSDPSQTFTLPSTPSFSDVPKTHWAFENVEKAKAWGITSGKGNGLFGVNDKVTYQQAISFMLRLLKEENIVWETVIDYADYNYGLFSVEGFTSKSFTRGMMFELLNKTLLTSPQNSQEPLIKSLKTLKISNAQIPTYIDKLQARMLLPLFPIESVAGYPKGVDTSNPIIKTIDDVAKNLTWSEITSKQFFDLAKKGSEEPIGQRFISLRFTDSFFVSEDNYTIYDIFEGYIRESDGLNTKTDIQISSSEGYGWEGWTFTSLYKANPVTYMGAEHIPFVLKGTREYYKWQMVQSEMYFVILVNAKTGTHTGFIYTQDFTKLLEY